MFRVKIVTSHEVTTMYMNFEQVQLATQILDDNENFSYFYCITGETFAGEERTVRIHNQHLISVDFIRQE